MSEIPCCKEDLCRWLAKTVIVEIDGKIAMAVLLGSQRVDLELLRDALGADRVVMAREADFKDRFPGVRPGAMPPFGNLYGMPVYIADIAFNAGSRGRRGPRRGAPARFAGLRAERSVAPPGGAPALANAPHARTP